MKTKKQLAYEYHGELTTHELFNALHSVDIELRFIVANVLLRRGGKNIIKKAINLSHHNDYKLREVAVYILGQIKIGSIDFEKKIKTELQQIALTEKSIRVCISAISALAMRCESSQCDYNMIVPVFKKHVNSTKASIRLSIATALSNIEDSQAIPFIEKLLQDNDNEVRNWTAFSIQQNRLDNKEIRNSLVAMLSDAYEPARREAICSLAFLRDRRVVPALKRELTEISDGYYESMVDAAVDFGDPIFIPLLENLIETFGDTKYASIQKSIEAIKELQQSS